MGLTLTKLTKTYIAPDRSALTVVDIPSFKLADAEQIALIGTSGSGKTTLLHMIAGILAPTSGNIIFDGGPDGAVDITLLSEAGRDVFRGHNIGYVFQTHHLLPGFTALENVGLGMTFSGRPSDPKWAQHLLTEVGLGDRLHYKPEKLSVGQQQRVAVARALANRPRLVLADEPTGALDPANAQQVLDLIRKLCGEVNSSLILVSHDVGIASQLPRTLDLRELNQASKPLPATGAASYATSGVAR
jgi:ABC-type lipoprotein export system ATPase subunit